MALKVKDKAPEFSLYDTERKEKKLSDYAGKNVVLAFYPGAFTSVCQKELCTLRDSISAFNNTNAQVLGVSVDSPFTNHAFATQNELGFPLLCDFTRAVSKQYCGVHEDFAGLKGYSAAKRSVFVLDTAHVVKYAWISENPGAEPPYKEIEAALK